MDKQSLYNKLRSVEQMAATSKLGRFLKSPKRYVSAIAYREFVYKRNKREKSVSCTPFFGGEMEVLLPSSTDIYLTGGKSHASEINLARWMISSLKQGDVYLDVGAHYGYFSLLASALLGSDGRVLSFEAAPKTYAVLKGNLANKAGIKDFNYIVSDTEENLTFYEFPNLYSEYNTLDIEQYKGQEWIKDNPPREVNLQSVVLDKIIEAEGVIPRLIKIDVEGAEFRVLKGLKKNLETNGPDIVMEFLSSDRGNEEHLKAEAFLISLGYSPYSILDTGALESINTVQDYMTQAGLDSDNIVFRK